MSRTGIAAMLVTLALGGCVIDAGAQLRFDVEAESWGSLEVVVLDGACPASWAEPDGTPTRVGATRMLEGTLPVDAIVARYVLAREGGTLEESMPTGDGRLREGRYCVAATARDGGCGATALTLTTLDLVGRFGDSDVIRVGLPPTLTPALGLSSCGPRLCIAGVCEAIEGVDERCAGAPTPAACDLCEAIRAPTSVTASVEGRALCGLESRDGRLYASVRDETVAASNVASSYEVATLQVCATNCLLLSFYPTISPILLACAGDPACEDAVLRRAGESCGGCCAGLREAGPCGTALSAYVACATPALARRTIEAFQRMLSCHDIMQTFLDTYQCDVGSGCEDCRADLESTYAAMGASPSLRPDDDLTDLLISVLGCPDTPGG